MKPVEIVALDGAVRESSMSRKLLHEVVKAFSPARANVSVFSQYRNPLPIFDDDPLLRKHSLVQELLSTVAKADAIVLCSPEYHGSMSGALKNALDWCSLVPDEFSGKVVGLIGGGGSLGNSGATLQMMMCVRAMHGWLMPDVLVSVPKIKEAFSGDGGLKEPILRERILQFATGLTQYANLFREQRGGLKLSA